MGNQDAGSHQEVGKEEPPPPADRENPEFLASQEYDQNEASTSTNTTAATSAYHPFPPIMNAYYSYTLGGLKSLKLCGASENEYLCVVEVHFGFSRKQPLGTRPGLLLHNGPNTKDPILAATGDESMAAAKIYHFNLNSVILLPPIDAPDSEEMVTEIMRASTVTEDKDVVVFRFKIEVGRDEKRRREKFEWRSIKKRAKDLDASAGGFKLLHLSLEAASSSGESSTSRQDAASSSTSQSAAADGGYETVAVLGWTKATAVKHAFSLQLKGSGLAGTLGERWTLMVVVTALRLWSLHGTGRTNRTGIKIGEKMRNK